MYHPTCVCLRLPDSVIDTIKGMVVGVSTSVVLLVGWRGEVVTSERSERSSY